MKPSPLPPVRWWQWPTVLSCDAPLVVVVWQRLFAVLDGVTLHWADSVVLAGSVWLAYAADRWFEGWRVAPDLMRTPRHRFYQQWRWPMAGVWAAVLAGDLAVAFGFLTARELLAGTLLLGPTLLYVLSHQLLHRHHRWRAPKEFWIAGLLAGGAALFVLAAPGARIRPVAGAVGLFGALCFANVALISVWEREVDESHGQVSLARQFRRAAGFSRTLPWLLAVAGIVGVAVPGGLPPVAAYCVTASALLLGLVDRIEPRIGRRAARVLVDAALLTPALPLLARPR